MFRFITHCLFAAVVLLPASASADPITLKLAFFSSDRSVVYQTAVKPFVEAINREGHGFLHVDVYLSGTLGRAPNEMLQSVLDGKADIAFIAPGQIPDRFGATAAIEFPGLFRDAHEASLVHTRVVAAHALRGYEDLFVIAAFGTAPETIHSRKKLTLLADLKGQKIRINNLMEAAGLAKLGALPVMLVFNDTSPALSSGQLDGATVPVAQLFDVGIGRFTTYHYLLPTSTAPLALVMSQKAFERLPQDAKALIRKYGGEWLANQYATAYDAFNKQALERIKADKRRTVVTPSAADLKTADDDFDSVRQDWVGESEQNRKLMTLVQAELANVRQHETTARRIEPQ